MSMSESLREILLYGSRSSSAFTCVIQKNGTTLYLNLILPWPIRRIHSTYVTVTSSQNFRWNVARLLDRAKRAAGGQLVVHWTAGFLSCSRNNGDAGPCNKSRSNETNSFPFDLSSNQKKPQGFEPPQSIFPGKGSVVSFCQKNEIKAVQHRGDEDTR